MTASCCRQAPIGFVARDGAVGIEENAGSENIDAETVVFSRAVEFRIMPIVWEGRGGGMSVAVPCDRAQNHRGWALGRREQHFVRNGADWKANHRRAANCRLTLFRGKCADPKRS